MDKVLHITPHMGGGVGKVLSSISSYPHNRYLHKILLLEKPEKIYFIELVKSYGIEVCFLENMAALSGHIKNTDIVQIEWWQHPKTMEVLANFPEIPCNLIIWSHVNGCHYPFLSFDFLQLANFVFTTQYSYDNPYWSNEQQNYIKQNNFVVNSSGGFENQLTTKKKKHKNFHIGYSGTLSFSKLSPNFIQYCREANVSNARFIMLGDKTGEHKLLEEANAHHIDLVLKGYVNNVTEALSHFDVFGYPLAETHFGTTENALLEAMAYGVVPICMNQNTEKYIITHAETGFLANDGKQYGAYIKALSEDRSLLQTLGENASCYVKTQFSLKNTVSKMEAVYDTLVPKAYNFKTVIGDTPFDWFLSGLNPSHRHIFASTVKDAAYNALIQEMPIFLENSKGSIKQFYKTFPEDERLGMLI